LLNNRKSLRNLLGYPDELKDSFGLLVINIEVMELIYFKTFKVITGYSGTHL
jgi:hypothetical protein